MFQFPNHRRRCSGGCGSVRHERSLRDPRRPERVAVLERRLLVDDEVVEVPDRLELFVRDREPGRDLFGRLGPPFVAGAAASARSGPGKRKMSTAPGNACLIARAPLTSGFMITSYPSAQRLLDERNAASRRGFRCTRFVSRNSPSAFLRSKLARSKEEIRLALSLVVSRRASGRRHRVPHLRHAFAETLDDRIFAGPRWSRHDE